MEDNESVAVAMWPTPWYLRMVGYPAWRVKEKIRVIGVAIDAGWEWKYYTNIHDYANKNSVIGKMVYKEDHQ